ncbi:peptide-methionine (S)-S-oxide reductase MsrA [Marinomonas posidonica]|uniref:Peptide methionine sulfoxide reductase MsrA n=1 Tax=Marinomonas posidonica (strain CECT 7376 / NCIMB 14433 / IVIA-Po-181) TaxID=491952 RepID=F6CZ28_MARPP|nr:peptide-methionine (S)-S-oxide reductase MsrA [Marinomonas posidonica]AEF53484.1 Peptide methionine sulfoxide reductase msrA [Marinomonas posidonica IVIA-Po-181]
MKNHHTAFSPLKPICQSILTGWLIGSAAFAPTAHAEQQRLIVAGGCFWCVESDFEKVPGVIKVESGYTGGQTLKPTYKQVSLGKTGHYEAVEIVFEDDQVSLTSLVDYFWKTIDPTDASGQFCDKGAPYRTGLFYQNESQRAIFEASLAKITKEKPFNADIVTPILPASEFYLAEQYHQDYYKKNPIRYGFYRSSCGRDRTIEQLWGEVASKDYH